MADKLKLEEKRINEELSQYMTELASFYRAEKSLQTFLSLVEDHCVDTNQPACIAKIDAEKQIAEEAERRMHKEFHLLRQNCMKFVHHTAEWTDSVPVKSADQLRKATSYLECVRPHFKSVIANKKEVSEHHKKTVEEVKRMSKWVAPS